MSNSNPQIYTSDNKSNDIGKVDFETLKNILPKNIVTESETIKK